MKLSDFERAVLTACFEVHPEADTALAQLEKATVTNREYTGCGVFVHLQIENARPLEDSKRTLEGRAGIFLSHPELKDGADVIVFLKDGILDFLEMVTFGPEDWPKNGDTFVIERSEKD